MSQESERNEPAIPLGIVTSGKIVALDREAVRAMLKRIAELPRPTELDLGAMCYRMASPPSRAEYVCTTCGERTVYTKANARVVERDLPSCRREFEELKKVAGDAVSLDESQFCRKCNPDAKGPKLVLTLTYQGGQKRSVSGVSDMDIRLIREFLAGKAVHQDWRNHQHAMKDHLRHLQDLLGVKRE